MNAPANLRRDSYIPTVQALLPGCEGDELRLRCGILLMRDFATAQHRWSTEEAGIVLEHIQRLATAHAFASMPADRLEDIHHALVRLGTVATDLARIFPAASAEGEDARG